MTKIMLVEDDNNLREIYEARLAAEGYEIVAAQDGEAALAIAGKEKPDLIISDVMMPKISGFEMLDILRNTDSLRSVKIIMLTALGQAEDAERANHLGADRYLVKSQVTLEDIVNSAHELLEGAAPAPAPKEDPGPDAESVAEAIQMPAAPVEEANEPASATPETPVAAEPATLSEESAEPVVPVASEPAVEAPTPAPAPATEPAPAPFGVSIVEPPAAEPAAPAPATEVPATEPASFVVEPPATEPAEPAVATPAAPELPPAPAADVEPAPADENSPQLPTPVADTPDTPEFAAPAVPAGGGPVISIPVVDAGPAAPADDTTSTDAAAPAEPSTVSPDNFELHPVSNLPVTPEAPAAPAPDFTSPASFNQFQAPPASGEAQSNAEEVASIQDQINAFVKQTEQAPVAEPAPVPDATPVAEPSTITEEPAVAPEPPVVEEPVLAEPPAETPETLAADSEEPVALPEPSAVFSPTMPAAPAVEPAAEAPAAPEAPVTEPVSSGPIIAMPTSAPAPELDETPVLNTAPSFDTAPAPVASAEQQAQGDFNEPIADELEAFSAPVITGPPSASTTTDDEDTAQLEAAVHNLEDNATETPAAGSQPAPQDNTSKKVISPIVSSEPKKDINQLLELEQAKTGAQQAAVAIEEPKPHVDAYSPTAKTAPPVSNEQSADPTNISL